MFGDNEIVLSARLRLETLGVVQRFSSDSERILVVLLIIRNLTLFSIPIHRTDSFFQDEEKAFPIHSPHLGATCKKNRITMANESTHQDRLHWTGGYLREAVWPREPDVDVVRSLAKHHLASELPLALDDALLEVVFFAEGGFNKLYEISYADHPTNYILRVALPVIPFYKTESEVATIAYVRANTSIPVPRIFAWDSNCQNELTYEWILMEKLAGVPLWDVWRQVSWDRKLELTEEVAAMIAQLQHFKFDRIGSLFFESALKNKSGEAGKAETEMPLGVRDESTKPTALPSVFQNLALKDRSTDTQCPTTILQSMVDLTHKGFKLLGGTASDHDSLNVDPQRNYSEALRDSKHSALQDLTGTEAQIPEPTAKRSALKISDSEAENSRHRSRFSVDQICDPLFFKESRLYLPGNRGSYKSALEWMSAEVQVQLAWIKNGAVGDEDEYGSNFMTEAPKMEAACREFLDFLPSLFAIEEQDSFILHHHDLNAANILVDPVSFKITGIVDWEMINVVPEWTAAEYPKFTHYIEPWVEEESPVPSYENENSVEVEARDQWEYKALRRRWDEAMKRLNSNEVSIDDTMTLKAKRDCYEIIPQLTDEFEWSLKWLERYMKTGVSTTGADSESETYGDSEGSAED